MKNIVLIGFMGTGKSAVGQILARRLGWTFIDIDRRVEIKERATIPQIFARRGEGHFREVEARIIADVAGKRDAVIATGGGAVLRPENMRALRDHGWVVSLTAPPDLLLKRLTDGERRPLLRGDVRGNIVRLLDQRRPLYRDADLMIDVSVATPERVADAVMEFLGRRARQTLPVRLDGREYPVHVGEGILPLLGPDLVAMRAGRRVALLTHRAILRAAGALLPVLKGHGFDVTVLEVPAGEQSKSLPVAGALFSRLARAKLDRHSTLIALGGGVIGDLGGFVAATYMRGIRLVHVPTTLLAMVDSSIGGKTGVIGDADLFEFIEENLAAVLRRDTAALVQVITRCAAFKARVVEVDEAERAERHILNYGHTIGHAVEAAAGFHRLTHGEAVAIGMALEARLAQRLGLTGAATVERQNALLTRAGLPVKLGAVSRAAVWRALALDKKGRDGVLRWPLLVGIGTVRREQEVPDGLLAEVLGGQGARRVRAQPQPAR